MKAKHLTEALKNLDPESDVVFEMISGCCGDYEYLEPTEDEPQVNELVDTKLHKGEKWLTIEFYPLPGYRSCIQAGGTVRAHAEYWKKFGKNPDGTPLKPEDEGSK